MMAVPETINTDPELVKDKPALASLTADERAELVWGDEANGVAAFHAAPVVHVGQPVLCLDGNAGRVEKAILDSAGQLRQIIVRLGRFWGREVIVPIDWIQVGDQTGLHLAVEKRRLHELADYWPDAQIAAEARGALRDAGLLRGSDDGDITVSVCAGVAALTGHVSGLTDKVHAAQAILKVRGVRAIRNDLVLDDDLVNLVAQALVRDERTRRERIFVAANHGVVILSGLENGAHTHANAEEIAASVPSVRAVQNYINRPESGTDDSTQRVVQPRAGQEVFASDMSLGRVERLIIDPHNRRVVAIVVRGQFPDRRLATSRMQSYEMPTEERRLVIPVAEISLIAPTEVQLNLKGMAAAGRDDFVREHFTQPNPAWRPPYPFAADECLWTRP